MDLPNIFLSIAAVVRTILYATSFFTYRRECHHLLFAAMLVAIASAFIIHIYNSGLNNPIYEYCMKIAGDATAARAIVLYCS